jgi:hypothetical protein
MAKFRQVFCGFWNEDIEVFEKFTPDEKYFYLYLLTNPHTSASGIYKISVKHMTIELGYSSEVVHSLLERFEKEYKKIRYNRETNELALKNWLKFNDIKSPTTRSCILKELDKIQDRTLISYLGYEVSDPVSDAPSMPPIYPIGEKEKEKEKDKEKRKEEPAALPPSSEKSYPENIIKTAEYLRDKIKLNSNPRKWLNNPPNLQKWFKDIDMLVRVDGVNFEDVRGMIDWCTAHSFWSGNILSAQALREKYTVMEIQRKNKSSPVKTVQKSNRSVYKTL